MIRRQDGYTLSELMVSAGLISVVTLGVSFIILLLIQQYSATTERLLAEQVAYNAEYMLRQVFSSAVDISATDNIAAAGPTMNFAGLTGQIRGAQAANYQFIFDQIGDVADPDGWASIAAFYREAGTNPDGQVLVPTGLWWRRPEAAAGGNPSTAGVLFIDMGRGLAVSPDYGDEYFDRLTYLEMQKTVHPSGIDKSTSVRIRFRVRYHRNKILGQTWCPQLDIDNGVAGCNNQSAHIDIERSFSVVLGNNLLKSDDNNQSVFGDTKEQRVSGTIYFFQLLNPQVRSF